MGEKGAGGGKYQETGGGAPQKKGAGGKKGGGHPTHFAVGRVLPRGPNHCGGVRPEKFFSGEKPRGGQWGGGDE